MVDTVEKIPMKKKKISLSQEVFKRLLRNKMAVTGLVILLVVLLASIFAPFLFTFFPHSTLFRRPFQREARAVILPQC